MTSNPATLGRRLRAASPAERFELHAAHADRSDFAAYDAVLGGLFDRAIRGGSVVEVTRATSRTEVDSLALSLSEPERNVLAAVLTPAAQQARGSWYLPDTDRPQLGTVEFAHWAMTESRFSISVAEAQRASVTLDSPDGVAVWAALEPVMEVLFLPLKLRGGYWLGKRRPEQMEKDWTAVDAAYATLAIDTAPLAVFKDGRRWATLAIEQVIAARQELLAAWARAPADVGERAIAMLIFRLLDRYYDKAKDGRAQRTKVMNRGVERALSGSFGGDWLAFVRYLGEELHPAEQVSTVVASTSLLVSGHDRTARAAASTGVPIEEIERVLAAYWGGQHASPIEERATVMRDWWKAFDQLHARQAPGMPSLWGLIGDRLGDIGQDLNDGRYTPGGYRMLSAPLVARIEELWGTIILPRWPESLVTEPYPHAAFAETFGPGAAFWQEVALTCWFICEGPYSRTDIVGMPTYYDRHLNALQQLGCAVDPAIFADLEQAEKKLSDRPLEGGETIERELGAGLSVSVTISTGQPKKDGFEYLRDVVTRHRVAWAELHLERYLQARWEQDLRSVGDSYHRHLADKGKAPTLRQFAKLAAQAADHWFAGDIAQLAGALQLPQPQRPQQHRRLLPPDHAAFVARLRTLLDGARWQDSPNDMDRDERGRRLRRSELAERAPLAVQIWEATGERPPLKGTSWARERLETAFGPDLEAGWDTFLDAVEQALRDSDRPTAPTAVTSQAIAETAD